MADPRFARWYRGLSPAMRASIASMLGFVAANGPDALTRPRAARVESSRHFPRLWELRRAEHQGQREVVLRVLVALHSDTTAVVLVGGDKAGNWVEWYEVAVPTADAYYDEFLRRQP